MQWSEPPRRSNASVHYCADARAYVRTCFLQTHHLNLSTALSEVVAFDGTKKGIVLGVMMISNLLLGLARSRPCKPSVRFCYQ